ncbi:hypothetical protein NLI96_g4066 [Meripilus lineatus]|uniref:Peptidase S9 prolyl oligopeptidase catalytic domain-containing protein n=1 Tax=Meripilus lineatus TaxID=2056292 RepID=A0AAD5V5N7_9APHY|nr:hypothetical protein NLI96_g4066 [Physisporinus lineatus]
MSTSKKTTKLTIPHPDEEGVAIVGTLEQVAPEEPTQGRGIAFILHGTMGHKDYLFQKPLAQKLPIDSFRLDFRGNHESNGEWRVGGFVHDTRDIDVALEYLKKHYGYTLSLIVGHSRGSISGFRWICTREEGKAVRGFVNISGRYRMEKGRDNATPYQRELDSQGWYEVKATVARKPFVGRVTKDNLEEFTTFDSSYVWDRFPNSTHALSIHGLSDQRVPPYDATIYARALGTRTPGTHNLYLVEDADHNFKEKHHIIVDTILEWWDLIERNRLKTGVWHTGFRGKL